MATFTIKSRTHGPVTFYVMGSGREPYVKYAKGNHADSTSRQICYGGYTSGNAITATPDTLEAEARRWWRQYLKNERTM